MCFIPTNRNDLNQVNNQYSRMAHSAVQKSNCVITIMNRHGIFLSSSIKVFSLVNNKCYDGLHPFHPLLKCIPSRHKSQLWCKIYTGAKELLFREQGN